MLQNWACKSETRTQEISFQRPFLVSGYGCLGRVLLSVNVPNLGDAGRNFVLSCSPWENFGQILVNLAY